MYLGQNLLYLTLGNRPFAIWLSQPPLLKQDKI